jgi:hypothetical protein
MNLLPITEKEALKKGFKLRFFILASLIAAASLICGSIMLLPSYFLAAGNFSKDSLGYSSGDGSSTSTQELLNLPKEIDSKLKLLQSNGSNIAVTDPISKTIENLPAGIKLHSISFDRDKTYKDKKGTVILISGVAAERDSLVSYLALLKVPGLFSDVDMPVSNLAKDVNLPFSINIFIEKQK